MNTFFRFLKQPSTWKGLTWLLTLFGVVLSPEQREAIGVAGIAIVAAIEMFSDEDSRAVTVNLPPIELQAKPLHERFADKGYEPHSPAPVFDESQFDERGFNRQSRHDRDDGYMNLDTMRIGLELFNKHGNEAETTRNPDELDVDRRLSMRAEDYPPEHDERGSRDGWNG